MYDLIVIGSGPAGLSAALYASRAGADVLVLDGGTPGGKLNFTAEIENYPGLVKSGPELAYAMYEHCLSFGAVYEFGQVTKIENFEDKKIVYVDETEYETKNIFIATGTKERKMHIPLEEEMTGKGVSYCAVCDGPFFKNKTVTVVGGGNSAIEEAVYLSDLAAKVNVIVRRDELRADQSIVDKLKSKENIRLHYLKKPHRVIEKDGVVCGIEISDSKTGELSIMDTDAIFPFVGLDPVTEFVSGLGITNKLGYIQVDDKQETKMKGIFAGGDVTDKHLRQVVTAASDGAIAGQYIASHLEEK